MHFSPRRIFFIFFPFLFLIFFLGYNVYYFGSDSSAGPNQIALLSSAAVVIGFAIFLKKMKFVDIEKAIVRSISKAMPAIIILLLIGALTASWLFSGIIPAMVYYGTMILHPDIFLPSICIISAIVSVSIGSSWSTIATIGIAFISIGKVLGFNEGIVAGAIISGAYFGDKLSPLSDTTNLASAMSGVNIIEHIRYMLITTLPSILISLILYLIINLSFQTTVSNTNLELLRSVIQEEFSISLLLFIVPIVMLVMIIKRVPVIIALFFGSLLAIITGYFTQQELFLKTSDISFFSFATQLVSTGFSINISPESGKEITTILNDLFSASGMSGMLNTIWLIICAMIFGGALEVSKILEELSLLILRFITSVRSLIVSNVFFCLFINTTTADQYISVILPAEVFKKLYPKFNLSKLNLSRTLEDSGTVTSVLIPWNTCGAVQASVLGVATLQYLPYSFFNILSPIMTILIVSLNIKIKKTKQL